MSNSYLLVNKLFIDNKEVKFTNISVEVNIATVPGARITTKEEVDVPKGAKVEITTRIISEYKLTECKNNYFKKLHKDEPKLKEFTDESDSGNRVFYQGRVYAIANTSSESMSMKTIVAIGKAHHLKSIKVPVWTDVKEKKLKNMVKFAFKGWPLKMESVSTKLNSFKDTAKSNDSGSSIAKFMGAELYNIVYSKESSTGIDSDVFDRMKEDLNTTGDAIKMNYIPFKSMFSGARSFVNGKFKELLEKIKDDSNPDFLAFWQVLLDIFDVEIVFLPFDINGSSILVKPRYDEIAPSAKHINVVLPREISHANRFSNSFREATRVMLNVYTETDVSNFPVYMNYCQAEYVKSMGGFLYNITQFGTQENKTDFQKAKEAKEVVAVVRKEVEKGAGEALSSITGTNKTIKRANGTTTELKFLAAADPYSYGNILNTGVVKTGLVNEDKKNRANTDYTNELKEAAKKLEEDNKAAADAEEARKVAEASNKAKEATTEAALKAKGVFINLSSTGIEMSLTNLEKEKGVVDVSRDMNYFDVTVAGNDLDNAISGTPKTAKSMAEAKKQDDDFRASITKANTKGSEGFSVIDGGFEISAKRILVQNMHDLIFGERNLSFSSIFIPTILPGLPVIMFESEDNDLCYSKVSGVVHNITPYGSSSDISGIRTIDSDEGVSLSTFHTFYKESGGTNDTIGGFMKSYGIEYYEGNIPLRTRTISGDSTDEPAANPAAGIAAEDNKKGFKGNLSSSIRNETYNKVFRRYPIAGEYIDAKYMKYTYDKSFTKTGVFDIMLKRYNIMPEK